MKTGCAQVRQVAGVLRRAGLTVTVPAELAQRCDLFGLRVQGLLGCRVRVVLLIVSYVCMYCFLFRD